MGLASSLEGILITQHGLLPGLAGSRDFLSGSPLEHEQKTRAFWLSLGVDTKQYHGADTNLGWPSPDTYLREALALL